MDGTNYTKEELGRILSEQRKRVGRSQGDIAKALDYSNVNFISMIESGKSKIPINRIAVLVDAYSMSPEFILVILRVEYPEYLDMIASIASRFPKIFKRVTEDQDKEISNIYNYHKQLIGID
ncbi:MAG: helix-turn-helix transcriptional regulator [Chlorobium sp.]|nr:helix-turn-helix transcriptional regulator [Chlorobium sp.]